MNYKFFTFEKKKKYFSGVNDYISTQTYIMAEIEIEKREKRKEKRDGFQPFYSYPGFGTILGFLIVMVRSFNLSTLIQDP